MMLHECSPGEPILARAAFMHQAPSSKLYQHRVGKMHTCINFITTTKHYAVLKGIRSDIQVVDNVYSHRLLLHYVVGLLGGMCWLRSGLKVNMLVPQQ